MCNTTEKLVTDIIHDVIHSKRKPIKESELYKEKGVDYKQL